MEPKSENVVLAKVDATEENELSQEYDVQGFTTIHFFVDGVHKPYASPRTKASLSFGPVQRASMLRREYFYRRSLEGKA